LRAPARHEKPTTRSGRRSPVLLQLDKLIERRIGDLSTWLMQNASYCGKEQAHLSAGSREQAYWHHGYAIALRDIRAFLRRQRRSRR
jgi:hypothetical protein